MTTNGARTMAFQQVQVIGAGHVGLVLALHLAESGFAIDVVDLPHRISQLENSDSGFHEPGIQQRLGYALRAGLVHLYDRPCAAAPDRVSFICIGDPGDRGVISANPVLELVTDARSELDTGTVCIRSTVPVGTTRQVATTLPDATVLHVPEFLREGSAFTDLAAQGEVVIGMSDPADAMSPQVSAVLTRLGVSMSRSTWETTESLKILRNALNAVRICFVNEAYAAIGGNWTDPAYIAQRLITLPSSYGMPGLPPGGSCLPAAIKYVIEQATLREIQVPMLAAVPASSTARLDAIAAAIVARVVRRVLILGVSYRPSTDDLTASWALRLTELLVQLGCEVRAVDPYMPSGTVYGLKLVEADDGVAWAEHIVLAVAHPELVKFAGTLDPEMVTDVSAIQPTQAGAAEVAAPSLSQNNSVSWR